MLKKVIDDLFIYVYFTLLSFYSAILPMQHFFRCVTSIKSFTMQQHLYFFKKTNKFISNIYSAASTVAPKVMAQKIKLICNSNNTICDQV